MVDALLAWADGQRRDLPWRRTRDPWAILVSETMLQQTQVDRVVPKYLAFLERFPDAHACASSSVAEVITLWAGLGYNRRAVNLHRAATSVATRSGGRFPTELADLSALPGVGPYTARAIQVFAFEVDVGVVDTNVGRILARLGGRPLGRRQAQERADRLVPAGDAWRWNQGLFDLGAQICTKRRPGCGACPVRSWCDWHGDGSDPAVGSAATSVGQSRFEGSFRQGRGRLVASLRGGPVEVADVGKIVGWDDIARIDECIAGLVDDGLVEQRGDSLVLAR